VVVFVYIFEHMCLFNSVLYRLQILDAVETSQLDYEYSYIFSCKFTNFKWRLFHVQVNSVLKAMKFPVRN